VLFQTPEFLVLFVLSMLGVAFLKKNRQQHIYMAILSYIFYAWWDVRFVALLLVTSQVDFVAAQGMDGIKVSWGQRMKLAAVVVVGSIVTLGVNWPMLQHGTEAFAWNQLLDPKWKGVWESIAACGAFAILAPIFYEFYFKIQDPEKRRKAFLWTSVVANLTVLGFFKYFDFFTDSLHGIGAMLDMNIPVPHLEVLLPVGISFYTFVAMSYTIDVYRKQFPAERSFLRFALFVCYYPHLVAGPIIRPDNFLPSLNEPWVLRGANILSGFHLCLNGFVKKVLIADNIARLVDVVFSDPAGQPTIVIWLATVVFAVQIYCDFSGYSDIARGVSRMFGVELPLNFDYPYFSTSIIDFWRRWHLSLSTWLRDYLYIPLGGGRGSPSRVYFNLMTTMVLGGMWHGASWNFVIWGAYQGGLLCINRLLRGVIEKIPALDSFLKSGPGSVIRWVVTMYFVMLGWLIFRIVDTEKLIYCMKKFVLFDGRLELSALGVGKGDPIIASLLTGAFFLFHAWSFFGGRIHDRLDHSKPSRLPLVYAGLALVFFFLWPAANAAFIYFQF
jgi:D-alanyl-lipoteichoic acid acyltransferase DltB (MBOAT superfamily)